MNQMFTILPSYIKIITKKENKSKWLKVNNSIYFTMQKVKSIFKISFCYDLLTSGFKGFSYDWNKMVQQICRETRIITRCSQTDW